MKIFQIIPALSLGGAETMCEALINALIDKGHDVTLISLFSNHTPIADRLENCGVRVIYLDKKKGFDYSQFFKLRNIFSFEKPDVIHMHLTCVLFAMPAAIQSGIKTRVYTLHYDASRDSRLRSIAYHFFMSRYGMRMVALSKMNKESAKKRYGHIVENIPIVSNGIDQSRCIVKKDYSFNESVTLIHIGRFVPIKNHEMLLEAFADVVTSTRGKSLKLKLIGEGELLNAMKLKAKELNLESNVEFAGTKSSCYDELGNSEIFILPSHSEGMPITLIEAMATGLPCIATCVGGIPDVITDGKNGLLIENNRVALSNAIRRLINDEDLRKKLGEGAKKRAEEYSSIHMAEEYLNIYKCK